jgi:hypothetical protein
VTCPASVSDALAPAVNVGVVHTGVSLSFVCITRPDHNMFGVHQQWLLVCFTQHMHQLFGIGSECLYV